MADLVQEATGIDFGSYAGDLEGAKVAALEALKKADVATRPVVKSLLRELTLIKPSCHEVLRVGVEGIAMNVQSWSYNIHRDIRCTRSYLSTIRHVWSAVAQ